MSAVLANPQLMNQAANPDLNDFTYYNNRSYGGISPEEMNSTRAQSMLNNLHKYDSDAKFNPTYGSDGNLLGYQLQFDPSKLPGVGGTGQLGGANPSNNGSYAGGSGFMPRFSTVQEHMNLANPNAVAHSDHYGNVTSNKNIYDKMSMLDILGPLAVGGFGMLAGGGGALASLLQKAPGAIGSVTNNGGFNPFKLGALALPFIPGMNPVMSQLGRMGLNYLGGNNRG